MAQKKWQEQAIIRTPMGYYWLIANSLLLVLTQSFIVIGTSQINLPINNLHQFFCCFQAEGQNSNKYYKYKEKIQCICIILELVGSIVEMPFCVK